MHAVCRNFATHLRCCDYTDRRSAFALPRPEVEETSEAEAEARGYMRLAHAALEAQRAALLEERAIGQYSSRALLAAAEALDQYEIRLTPPQGH